MDLPYAEPFRIKMVETIRRSNRQEREQWLEAADYNLFRLRSEQVFIDLLTDSGCGAMSDHQWAALMTGDESYAGSSSFYALQAAVEDLTGFPLLLPTHQGRGAENIFFSALIKPGHVVPGNSPFDTTRGHLEQRQAVVVDCTVDEARDPELELPFKGNVCIQKLEETMAQKHSKVPFILVTITNNMAGGQAVSMANLREVRRVADNYGVRVVVDAARFPENAYFIKMRETCYNVKSIQEISREMFALADAMTMSAKKGAIVNTGGFLATRHQEWYDATSAFCIMNEGYLTYGGLAGRDLNAMAVGLYEGTEFEVLDAIVRQVTHLGRRLAEQGVPCQRPAGGHAIYVDAGRALPNVPWEEFPAQTLSIELYLEAGVRACEVGRLLAGRDPTTHEDRLDGPDFLRLAVPRRVYSNGQLDVAVEALRRVYNRRDAITRGVRIISEAPLLRHFTVRLERLQGVLKAGPKTTLQDP